MKSIGEWTREIAERNQAKKVCEHLRVEERKDQDGFFCLDCPFVVRGIELWVMPKKEREGWMQRLEKITVNCCVCGKQFEHPEPKHYEEGDNHYCGGGPGCLP